MYKRVCASQDFELGGKSAPLFPVIVNTAQGEGRFIVNELNSFLRASFKARGGIKKVKDAANHLEVFFNFMGYIRPVGIKKTRLFQVIEADINAFRDYLKSDANLNTSHPSTRNAYIKTVYNFYWHCEYRLRACAGVIGFNDPSRDMTYQLPVTRIEIDRQKLEQGRQFSIPGQERAIQLGKISKTSSADWTKASATAANDSYMEGVLGLRDHLMIESVRLVALRKDELRTLSIDLFERRRESDEDVVFIQLNSSKNQEAKGGARTVQFPGGLYDKIRRYAKGMRKKLADKQKHKNNSVFLSKNGNMLDPKSLGLIFRRYGLVPHDGRRNSLTDLFVNLIETGFTQQEAIFWVAEFAGHSHKTNGETLKRFYLQAKAIVRARQRKGVDEQLAEKSEQLEAALAEISSLRQQLKLSSIILHDEQG